MSTRQRKTSVRRRTADDREVEVAGVRLTHPNRVLYPEQGLTKLDLASYYVRVADWILPHLSGRPLTLVRCPQGRHKECFYQKHLDYGVPKTLRLIDVTEKHKTGRYAVVEDLAGLVSLVQMNVLEIHAWGARADAIERPDRLVFDLDPDPSLAWAVVVRAALELRDLLRSLGLTSFVKTTGGKGLHVTVPVERRHDWSKAKGFAHAVAELLVQQAPERYTSNMSKAARTGKIYVDYLRNDRGATSVVPYSTRAKPGAPVSAPLGWSELSARLRPDRFTVASMADRLASLRRDPWAEVTELRQSLRAASRNAGLASP